MSLQKYEDAHDYAYIITQLGPKYAKAWARLGIAGLKLGNANRARNAYQRVVDVGRSSIAMHLIKQRLADGKTTDEANRRAI